MTMLNTLRAALLPSLLPVALSLGVLAQDAAAQAAAATPATPPLSVQVYRADAGSFHVGAVLVSGRQDAVLLDTGFTRADALRIAAMVLDSKKTLKTIYISQPDPDFYFGAEVLRQQFPQARLVSTAPTRRKIEATLANKLQVWGPRLGANAPQHVPLPEALPGAQITLEDQVLEIRGLDDRLPHRSYVWMPAIRTIAGGVNVFAGLHLWTADAQSAQERADWSAKLAGMAALQPAVVIPGHAQAGQPQDATLLAWNQAYLARYERELPQAADSRALIDTMRRAYPEAGLGIALEIGAKVNKGEMKW